MAPGIIGQTGSTTNGEAASAAFRKYLPDLNTPRFITAKEQDAYEYSNAFKQEQRPPWLYNLTQVWQELLEEPYVGLTSDGQVKPNLFEVQNEGVRTDLVVEAVKAVLYELTPHQSHKLRYPINATEWRAWSNPEILLRPLGLRLEEVSEQTGSSILSVIEASFSRKGYEKAIAAMRINHFLGEICEIPKIMNMLSYNFLLFGEPSETEAWGWSLYGHHLCLNVFFKGPQIVISPTFTGAEPNLIDAGEFMGTQILHSEGDLGLELMQSLSPSAQAKAQIFRLLRDPKMQSGDLKHDRWNKDDQRHLCGAFRDNRVVPEEGICVAGFNEEQKQLVLDIAEEFLSYLPDTARAIRKRQIEARFSETYFCWIGEYGADDPFYYRIQSPVIVFEFDHHSGVFLSNQEPCKFHTHTIVRTPNAGDYGCALRNISERLP